MKKRTETPRYLVSMKRRTETPRYPGQNEEKDGDPTGTRTRMKKRKETPRYPGQNKEKDRDSQVPGPE